MDWTFFTNSFIIIKVTTHYFLSCFATFFHLFFFISMKAMMHFFLPYFATFFHLLSIVIITLLHIFLFPFLSYLFKACLHYFSLFLKDKCISSLFRMKYIEKKFNLQLFFFPLFPEDLISPGLPRATRLLETSCLEKITVCVIETMLVTLPLVQMNKARREGNWTNQVQTKINIMKGLQTSFTCLLYVFDSLLTGDLTWIVLLSVSWEIFIFVFCFLVFLLTDCQIINNIWWWVWNYFWWRTNSNSIILKTWQRHDQVIYGMLISLELYWNSFCLKTLKSLI